MKIAIALDRVPDNFDIHTFSKQFPEDVIFKIGLDYFTRFGIPDTRRQIFLDLKFYDTPDTVYLAVKNVCQKVDYLTIHGQGGVEMVKSSVQARNEYNKDCKILVVTNLTSGDENSVISNDIIQLADGVVCSALNTHKYLNTFTVTPAIRPKWYNSKDCQKQVCTPQQAKEYGSGMLVIGRPIMNAENPLDAFNKIKKEIENN